MTRKRGPARDGGVWVMQEKCATCIFRPGNVMHLDPGRTAAMKKQADTTGTCIICHEVSGTRQSAVCRGYYENHQSQLLQVAERMGFIRYQEKPT